MSATLRRDGRGRRCSHGRIGRRSRFLMRYSGQSPGNRNRAKRMTFSKFLVICNARTGSTWLVSMLGELPDVSVDWEFKWRPVGYRPGKLHKVIPDRRFKLSEALERLSASSRIVGSKLVLDARPHRTGEFRDLAHVIPKEVRIIHLRRSYRDSFLSLLRGSVHLLHNSVRTSDSRLIGTLRSDENRALQMVDSWNQVARSVPAPMCRLYIQMMMANDRWIDSFSETHDHYMDVRYSEIPSRFLEICHFVGSTASEEDVSRILHTPPTRKIPDSAERSISNMQEIDDICRELQEDSKRFNFRSDSPWTWLRYRWWNRKFYALRRFRPRN